MLERRNSPHMCGQGARGAGIALRLFVTVMLATLLAGAATLYLGQSLSWTATASAPGKLWTAMPLVVRVPSPPVRVTSYAPGETLGSIVIPKMSLDSPLFEMANCEDQANLDRGPCHIGGTAPPGAAGNCAIAGHRSTYTRPFRQMGSLVVDDEIAITGISGTKYTYRVSRVWVVSPSEVSVLEPTPEPSLTLITCHPLGSDTSRLIVRAALLR